jgi:hypothetical protein
MIGPGQQRVDGGSLAQGEWVTVQYKEEGTRYLQRHFRMLIGKTTAVVTLQSRADVFADVEPTQQLLVDTVRPGDE